MWGSESEAVGYCICSAGYKAYEHRLRLGMRKTIDSWTCSSTTYLRYLPTQGYFTLSKVTKVPKVGTLFLVEDFELGVFGAFGGVRIAYRVIGCP